MRAGASHGNRPFACGRAFRRLAGGGAALLFCLSWAASAWAQTERNYGWRGTSSNTWATGANWVYVDLPVGQDPVAAPWDADANGNYDPTDPVGGGDDVAVVVAAAAPGATTRVWIYATRADTGGVLANTPRLGADGTARDVFIVGDGAGAAADGTLNGNGKFLTVLRRIDNDGSVSTVDLLLNDAASDSPNYLDGVGTWPSIERLKVAAAGKTTTLMIDITIPHLGGGGADPFGALTVSGGNFNTDGPEHTVTIEKRGDGITTVDGSTFDRVILRFAPTAATTAKIKGADNTEYYTVEFAPTVASIFRLDQRWTVRKDMHIFALASVMPLENNDVVGGVANNWVLEVRNNFTVDAGGRYSPYSNEAAKGLLDYTTVVCTGSFDGAGQLQLATSTTTGAVAAGAATIPVADLAQFPDPAGATWTGYLEGDSFTYTGKAAAGGAGNLTGVAGVTVAHASGAACIGMYFVNLEVADTARTVTLLSPVAVSNNFNVNGGTFTDDGANRFVFLARGDGTFPLTVDVGSSVTGGTISLEPSAGAGYGITLPAGVTPPWPVYNLRIRNTTAGAMGGASAFTALAAINVGNNLIVDRTGAGSCELTMGANNLTVSGTCTVGGGTAGTSATLSASTATLDINGTMTATNSSVTFTGAGRLELGGPDTNILGTFAPSTSRVVYNYTGGGQTVYSTNYYNLEIDNGGQTASVAFTINQTSIGNELTIRGSSVLDVNATFDLSGAGNRSVTFTGSGRLELGGVVGALAAGTGSFTASTGTVRYDRAGDQAVANVNYYDLDVANSGGGTATVSFDITSTNIGNAVNLRGAGRLTVTGGFDMASGASTRTLYFASNGRLQLNGAATSLGSFTPGTGTIAYSGSSAQTVVDAGYYNLEIGNTSASGAAIGFAMDTSRIASGGTFSIAGAAIADCSSTFDLPAATRSVTFSSNGTLILRSTVGGLGAFTAGTGTVSYRDTSAGQTVAAVNYYNLEINNGGKTATVGFTINQTSLGNTLAIAGASVLDVNATLDLSGAGNRSVTFTGSGRLELGGVVGALAAGTGSFAASTGMVRYDRSGTQDVADVNYYDLDINNGGATATASFSITPTNLGHTMTITGTSVFETAEGSGFDATGRTVTFTGAGRLELGGAVTGLGTFTPSTGTVRYDSSGTSQSVVVPSGGSYNVLEIANGAARTATAAGTLGVAGTLTVSGGKFDAGTGTVTVTGSTTINSTLQINSGTLRANGSFDASAGGVTFTGSGKLRLAGTVAGLGTLTAPSGTVEYINTSADVAVIAAGYYNLTIDVNGRVDMLTGTTTVANALTVSGGTLRINAASTTTVSGSATVAAGARWEINDNSTVQFASGVSLTVNGSFVAVGTGANRPILQRSGGAGYWTCTVNYSTGETFHLVDAIVRHTDRNGVRVLPGTISDPLLDDVDIDQVDFESGETGVPSGPPYPVGPGAASTYINLRLAAQGTTLGFSEDTFDGSTNFTVTTDPLWAGGLVEMSLYSGGGTSTENDLENGSVVNTDPNNTIRWVENVTWTGGGGTGWNTAGSWDPAVVPDQFTDVIIPDVANDPVLDGVGGSCRGLNVTTGILTIDSALPLNVYGDIANAGTISMSNGARIVLKGSRTVSLNAGASSFYRLQVDKSGGTATLTAGMNVADTCTINSATLSTGNFTLAVAGALTVAGTLQIVGGTVDANGSFDATGGTVTFTGAGRLQLAGAVTSLGSFTAGTGTVAYDGGGSGQTILTSGVAYNNLEVNKSGQTATTSAAAALSVGGDLTLIAGGLTAASDLSVGGQLWMKATAGTFNAGGGSHSVGGIWRRDGGTLNVASAPTFTLNGTTQSFEGLATTFHHLTIASSSTATMNADVTCDSGSTLTVQGGLRIAAGRTLTANGALTCSGALTYLTGTTGLATVGGTFNAAGGSVTFTTGGTLRLLGTVSSLGTLSAGSGTIVYGSTAAGQTVLSSGLTYFNLEVDKGAQTATSSAAATLKTNGAFTLTSGNFTAAAAMDFTGAVTIASGTFDTQSNPLTARDDFARNGGSFDAGTGTVTMSGTTQAIGGTLSTTFYNLAVGATSTTTVNTGPTISAGGVLTVNGVVQVPSGVTLTVSGDLVNSGTLSFLTGAAGVVDVVGSFNSSGFVTFATGGRLELGGAITAFSNLTAGSGTVRYDGAADQTVAPRNYWNLEIVKGASSGTLGGGANVGNALTITSGTLSAGGFTLDVTGATTNTGTLRPAGGTIVLRGTYDATGGNTTITSAARIELRGAVTSLGTLTMTNGTIAYMDTGTNRTVLIPAPSNYYNLEIAVGGMTALPAAGTLTVTNNVSVVSGTFSRTSNNLAAGGNLTVSNGATLSASTATITVTGTTDASSTGTISFSGAGTLNLDGSVTSLGTFSAGASSTVAYRSTTGAQTVGAVTYRDLRFENFNQVATATGTLTVQGTLVVAAAATPATFAIASPANVSITGPTVTVNGVLSLSGGCTLRLGQGAGLAGTVLTVTGAQASFTSDASGGSTPTLTSTIGAPAAAERYGFTVTGNATIATTALNMRYMDASGLNIASSASIACDVDGVRFENGSPNAGAVYLQMNVVGSFSFLDCVFEASVANQPTYNVRTPAAYGGSIEMLNAAGSRGGQPYENDTNAGIVSPGTITWATFKIWVGTGGTDWDTATSWNPNGQPTAADNVRIPDVLNDPILDTTDANVCRTLEITTGTLTFSGAQVVTLTVSGDFTNNGTVNMDGAGGNDKVVMAGTSSQRISMAAPVGAANTFRALEITNTTAPISLSSNVTVADTLALTGAGATLDIGSRTLTVTGAVSGTGTLAIDTGTADVNSSYSVGATTFTGTGRLQLGGGTNPTLGTFSRGTGTVAFDGAGVQIPTAGIEYQNIEANSSGTLTTAAGALVVWGNLSLLANNLTLGADLNLYGNLTLGASAGTLNGGGFSHTVRGNFTHNGGTLTAAGSPFSFSGTTQAIDGSAGGTTAFAGVTIAATSTTTVSRNASCSADLTNNGTLTVSSGVALTVNGTFNNPGNLTLATTTTTVVDAAGNFGGAGGTVNFTTGGTLRLRGTVNLGTLAAGSGNVEYLGTGGQTVQATTYYNLSLDGSTKSSGGAIQVNGALDVRSGATFAVNATTVTVSGGCAVTNPGSVDPITSGTLYVGGTLSGDGPIRFNTGGLGTGRLELAGPVTWSGAFTAGDSTVEYKSTTAGQTVRAVTYNHLQITKGAQTGTSGGSFSVGGNLTVSSGTFDAAGTTVTVTGSATVAGTLKIVAGTVTVGGTYNATGGSTTFTGAGRLDLGGLVTEIGAFTSATGCTVRYYRSAGAVTIDNVGYYHLEVDTTGQTASLAGATTASGDVVVFASATLDVGATTLGVTGALRRNGVTNFGTLTISTGSATVSGSMDATNGNVTFTGGGTLRLEGVITSLGTFAYATGSTVTYAGAGQSVLNLSAGTDYYNLRIESSGTDTAAGAIALAGSLTVASGTFALGANDLTVAGGATVSGTLTMSNGTADITGTTNAAGGAWTFTPGGSTGILILRGAVTSLGTFTAANSTVRFLGTVTQTIRPVGYYKLTVGPSSGVTDTLSGAATVSNNFRLLSGTLSIGAGGDLRIDGAGTVEDGTFSMSMTGILRLGGSFNVGSPSPGPTPTFKASGTSPNIPRVTWNGATRYAFSLNGSGTTGGTVDVSGLTFEYCDTDGMRLEAGTTIATLDGVSWKNGFAGAGAQTWLNFRLTGSTAYTFTGHDFDGVNFATYNVTTTPAYTGLITMYSVTGGRSGPTYENDQGLGTVTPGTIDWVPVRMWIGAVNSNWDNPGNWSPASVPGSGDEAIIPAKPLQPTLNVASAEIRALTITTGQLNITAANTLYINGNVTVNPAGTLNMTAGTIVFGTNTGDVPTGSRVQTINPGSSSFLNVTVKKDGGSIQTVASATFRVTGSLVMDAAGAAPLQVGGAFNASGATVTIDAGQELRFASTVTDIGTLTAGSGTIRYNGSSSQTVAAAPYHHLAIQSGAVATLAADTTLTGNLAVDAGTLDLSTYALTLNGAASTVTGTLRMLATAGAAPTLRLADGAALTAAAGSTFRATRNGSNIPTVTKTAAGAGGFVFSLGGTVDIAGLNFSYAGVDGLHIAATATITRLRGIAFTNASTAANSAHLRFDPAGVSVGAPGCTFDAANASGTPYNVRATGAGSRIILRTVGGGAGAGEAYDSDDDVSGAAWTTTVNAVGAGAGTILVLNSAPCDPYGGEAYIENESFTFTGKTRATTSTGAVLAGAATIPVADTAVFNAAGGSATIQGIDVFTYTGRSAASGPGNLTGVPAAGGNAVTAHAGGVSVVGTGAGPGYLTGVSGVGAAHIAGVNVGAPDGIADSGGAVVLWVDDILYELADDGASPTIDGFPQLAWDFNSGLYYSGYLVVHDATSAGADRLWATDEFGNPTYYYELPSTFLVGGAPVSAGDFVGTPLWWTDYWSAPSGDQLHVVYLGTTGGFVLRLIDTGAALVLDDGTYGFDDPPGGAVEYPSFDWDPPPHVDAGSAGAGDSVTSSIYLNNDGNTIYFGATVNGAARMARITVATTAVNNNLVGAAPSNIQTGFDGAYIQPRTTTTAAVGIGAVTIPVADLSSWPPNGTGSLGNDNFSYTGKSIDEGAGNLTGVTGVSAAHASGTTCSSDNGSTYLFCGSDWGGSAANTPLYRVTVVSEPSSPGENVSALGAMVARPFVEGTTYRVFIGDLAGQMIAVKGFEATLGPSTGWPWEDTTNHAAGDVGTAEDVRAAAWMDFDTGRLWFGDSDGHLYGLNSDGTTYATYLPEGAADPTKAVTGKCEVIDGVVYVPNALGHVVCVDASTGTVIRLYVLDEGNAIGNLEVNYDQTPPTIMAPSASGRVYYVPRVMDPTP